MPADGTTWISEVSQKILTWFSQREVKTPLAFCFRVVFAILLIVLASLYLAPTERRFEIFKIGLMALGVPMLIVTALTVFLPKNLVYGEAAHRAEWKLALGTEKRELTAKEIERTPATMNPIALPETVGQNPAKVQDGESR